MHTLLLNASNRRTFQRYEQAAIELGLNVIALTAEPIDFPAWIAPTVAVRAPTGLVAEAMRIGARPNLSGPDARWLADLGADITGRVWTLTEPAGAAELIAAGPCFIKLADGKHRSFPARRFTEPAAFQAAIRPVARSRDVALLATHGWLDIDAEYRVFTRGLDVLTASPYQIHGEVWSSQLSSHRAARTASAVDFIGQLLRALPADNVPPAAALDVAHHADGRMVLLEANQAWAAGLYSCDAIQALTAVLAANRPSGFRWRWSPDYGLNHRGELA